jgi:hypothetical protein
VIGLYAFLLLVLLLLGREPSAGPIPDPLLLVALLVAVFLVRYVSTRYRMDADRLSALRLFGSRTIPLEAIHRIELANLRELSPTGFFRGWGWRGRMWSPAVGLFDSVHTVSAGVLVYAGPVPLFVSPKDPMGFVTELSRRVRSYRGDVEVIVGARPGSPIR